MTVKQLSVFLENRSGRLTDVLETLGAENINITSLTVADTSEYGILRLIVSDAEKALQLLKSNGFSAGLTEVIALSIPHQVGSLAKILKTLSDNQLSIEYIYAFCLGDKAIVVLRTDHRAKAFEIITNNHFTPVSENDIKNM
ncbi:MAG: ACT domain-containing protein [Bacteroidales bacterium]|jgi:hypothetical protein|nr:ACT domain-containing protein [Bacteroidales bacterium]